MKISTANLGDSGYALFHVLPNDTLEMYFRSPPQQKTHNFPYQCGRGIDPSDGSQIESDDPQEADKYVHKVRDGDVVLVFTDGFHDNVFESGMFHCIEEYIYNGLVTSMSRAADCLARKAYFLGKNLKFQSPWMKELKHYVDNDIPLVKRPPEGFAFTGGKADDITVIVGQVFADAGPDDPRR